MTSQRAAPVWGKPIRWMTPEEAIEKSGIDQLFKETEPLDEDWLNRTIRAVEKVENTPARLLEKNTRNRRRRK